MVRNLSKTRFISGNVLQTVNYRFGREKKIYWKLKPAVVIAFAYNNFPSEMFHLIGSYDYFTNQSGALLKRNRQ